MDRITSRENPLIKRYRKLTGSRRLRESAGCFTMEGARLCLDAAQSGVRLQTLLLSEDGLRYPESALLLGFARQCFAIPNELARFISDTEHPQGIFAVGEIPQPRPFAPQEGKYILLDDLQDPGNLGTVLRTAEALGIDAVILSDHCPDLYSPKVIRSTMGSVFRQRTVRVSSLAESVAGWKRAGMRCFVIGNEGNGVSPAVIAACGEEVYIPMQGAAESLNAAVAAALCMWELSGRGNLPE